MNKATHTTYSDGWERSFMQVGKVELLVLSELNIGHGFSLFHLPFFLHILL